MKIPDHYLLIHSLYQYPSMIKNYLNLSGEASGMQRSALSVLLDALEDGSRMRTHEQKIWMDLLAGLSGHSQLFFGG